MTIRSARGWHQSVWGVVKRTLEGAYEDNLPFLASALSFDVILTSIPFLVLLLAVVGTLVQHQITTQQMDLAELLRRFMPAVGGGGGGGGAAAISNVERVLEQVVASRGQLTLVGLPLFLYFSTRLFGGLRAALNEVFDTEERRPWPLAKLIDLALVLLTGTLLLLSALLPALEARTLGQMGDGFLVEWLYRLSLEIVAFGFSTLLFLVVFKVLPSRRIAWRTAVVAAVICALAFELAKRLYALYVAHFVTFDRLASNANAGAFFLLILWIYYTNCVFLIGGEIAEAYDLADAARATGPAGMIDLRSDTVTRPSPEMRRAMAEAEVGDDVLDGDPTTRRLEEATAALLRMEDALFFPSGTQANQTGIALCTTPGTELIVEANAHLVHYEMAAVAALWGVQIRPVATPDGRLSAPLVRQALRPASPPRAPGRGRGGGEHPQRRRWPGLASGGDGGDCGSGARGGPAGTPRRRPFVERRRGFGRLSGTRRAGGDYRYGELFEGVGVSRGVVSGVRARATGGRLGDPQAPGWGDAAVRGAGRGRIVRPRASPP